LDKLGHEAMSRWVAKEGPPELDGEVAHNELDIPLEQVIAVRERERQAPGASKAVQGRQEGVGRMGGIDFRTLPIVTQAVSNLRAPIGASSMGALQRMNLSEEWGQIEQMVLGGIIPSSERIKEFIQASCAQGSAERDVEKVISCISGILRQEEEGCCSTDNTLRDILVVLEATNSGAELNKIFLIS
jgi:hypothetical protein